MITLKKSKKVLFILGAIVAGAAIYSSVKDKIKCQCDCEKHENDYEENHTKSEENEDSK